MKTFLSASVLPLNTTKEIFGFALKTLALTSAELFSALLLSEVCFSSEAGNEFRTSTDELKLQLEPRLKY